MPRSANWPASALRRLGRSVGVDALQERLRFGVHGPKPQRFHKMNPGTVAVRLVKQTIDSRVEVGPRIVGPQARQGFRDLGGFLKKTKLMIFRREEVEPRVVRGIGHNLFPKNAAVAKVSLPANFSVRRKCMIDTNIAAQEPAAPGQNRIVDSLMDPAAVSIRGLVRKQANDIIGGRALARRTAVQPLKV